MEIGVLRQKDIHLAGFVRTEPIPKKHDGPGQLSVQFAQEFRDLLGVDIGVRMKSEAETDAVSLARDRERPDDGDFLVGVVRWRKTGVWPFLAQVRRISGAISMPVSSRKAKWAFSRWRFF